MELETMLTEKKLSIFSPRYRYQILAAFTVHIITLSHGIGLGWLPPVLQLLQSPESPLSFILTTEQVSWVGAFFGLGFGSTTLVYGYLMDKIGRKYSMLIIAIPHMLLWVFVYFAESVEYLYASRFFGGATSGGLFLVVPIFLSEISDQSIRGALSSMIMTILALGILAGFILSSYLDYFLMPCVVIILPIIYIISCCFFPETPQFLMQCNKIEEAERSFRFYKNLKVDIHSSTESRSKSKEFQELKECVLKETHSSPLCLKDFLNRKTGLAFLTCVVVVFLNNFSGNFAFTTYTTLIFSSSGSNVDPNTGTIITGVAQVLGCTSATILVDRFGRKTLLLTSSISMGVLMCIFAIFLQFNSAETLAAYGWVPVVLMFCIVFANCIGVNALLCTVIVEVLPAKTRSILTSFSMVLVALLVFITLILFPMSIYDYGLHVTMYTCAASCFVSALYLSIFQPETKGMNFD